MEIKTKKFIVGEVGKGHGLVAQVCVHRHNGSSAGEREYLSMWPAHSCEREGEVFDAFCHSEASEIGVYDES